MNKYKSKFNSCNTFTEIFHSSINLLRYTLRFTTATTNLIIFKLALMVNAITPNDPCIPIQCIISELSFDNGVLIAVIGFIYN